MMDEDDGKPAPKRSASNVKSNGAADRGVFGPGAADMERVSSMENMEVMEGEMDTKVYCTCRNVSYGEMIGCDDDDCEIEWVSKGIGWDGWVDLRHFSLSSSSGEGTTLILSPVPPLLPRTQQDPRG